MEFEIKNNFNLASIPKKTGVYLFKDTRDDVLYVGKAKDLRARLRNYFGSKDALPLKISLMVENARYLQIILTETEKEALILESSLIKKHKPKFNVLMRDDKAYPFIKIAKNHPFPRVSVVRKRKKDGALYFGPYPSANALRQTLRILSKIFGLRTCSNNVMNSRKRPCLKYQIGLCCAPCVGNISKEEYEQKIKEAKAFLEGRALWLIKELEEKMKEASNALEFEKAALYRDQLFAVKKIIEKASVVCKQGEDLDVIFLVKEANIAVAIRHKIRDGLLQGQEVKEFFQADLASKEEILGFSIQDFYKEAAYVPSKIIVPFLPKDIEVIEDIIEDEFGKKIQFIQPKRGYKLQLLKIAEKNAKQILAQLINKENSWEKLSLEIKEIFRLKNPPSWIETIDISNTGDELAIGSLVCFINGEPRRDLYRHYNIETVKHQNDFAMIYEVVSRRIKKKENNKELPDLFLIDGGRGQLSMAYKAILEHGLDIEVIGIAKDRQDKQDKLYKVGESSPILLPRHHKVLLFFQRMRDEAHRFGINFHRKKRQKARFIGELESVPGVGKKRQLILIKHFGSVSRIKEASIEELKAVKGIPASVAEKIFEYFQKQK